VTEFALELSIKENFSSASRKISDIILEFIVSKT